jgi:16S rRNA (guanine1516-N2)-methyltransferase
MKIKAIVCTEPALRQEAEALAQSFMAPLHETLPLEYVQQTEGESPYFALYLDAEGLGLQVLGEKSPGLIRVDFVSGAVQHRRQFGGGKGQMIAKAVGLKSSFRPKILDATAGLGKDAFVLATLGCTLQLHERNPAVFALLSDGLQRAKDYAKVEDLELMDILSNISLDACDSLDYLRALSQQADPSKPDVIYLDPMFPERQKSASVKKEMKAFHSLVGEDADADEMLDLALALVEYRVVVKRPKKAPFISERNPSFQLEGKSGRYDIYTVKKMP